MNPFLRQRAVNLITPRASESARSREADGTSLYLRPRIALGLAPFALAVTLHAACTPAEVVEVARAGSIVIEAGEKCLLEAYEAEQEICLLKGSYVEKLQCVAKVRASEFWTRIKAAIAAYHEARCRLEPAKCAPATAPSASASTPTE